VTAVLRRLVDEHTDWCAGGHRCGLGEHRADPVVVELPGVGRLMLIRVQGADGRQHAEIRATVRLPEHDGYARLRLVDLLARLPRAIRGRW
jgi:hypothetical protein